MLTTIMDNQVWLDAYLRDTSWKACSVRFAHHLHPQEAAVVWAGDTGTIPFGYRNGCRNGAHR